MSCILIIYYTSDSHIVSCQTQSTGDKSDNTVSCIVFDDTIHQHECTSTRIKDPNICTTMDRYIKNYNLLHQRYINTTKRYGDGSSLHFKNKYTDEVAVYDEYNDTHIKDLIKDKLLNILSSQK